ncbi:MAG TPA: histidine kinase dimerization/phospho-acceptor domain-containing protein, partial [Spirochaetia bacterium]|nr:histidine kinase dimerization/phospho-acceptor domain-containing protein [Spirochaetia bacterium]
QQEILAEARKSELESSPALRNSAGATDTPAAEGQSTTKDEFRAAGAVVGQAAADSSSRQMALDAFAQNPALQSKVYEQAREKGDTVSPRVAQPQSRMAQNAPPSARSEPGVTDAEAAPVDTLAVDKKEAQPSPAAPGAAAPSPAPARALAAQQSQFVITSRLLSQIASQGSYGLIPRFIGDSLTFLFWVRQKDGRIAGCEVSVTGLHRRVASVLSGTYTPVRIITILDEKGAPLATPPDSAARNWRQPFVSREIGESLPRWEAAGYLTSPDVISAQARSSSFVIWIMVLILFVSVAGGGTLVLNSVYGEMRLAQKKATFVTNVSHELKTPLTSISLFVELLQRKRQPDARKRAQYLSIMASETERLTRLINNVLDFSAGERGGKRYAMKVVDAAQV